MNNIVANIRQHYDFASPYYKKLWGEHLHHGYYITGKETRKRAQENLIRLLVEKAGIPQNATILDIGCGIGGSAIWPAKNLQCNVTGITISPVQLKMAEKAASKTKPKPKFLLHDANNLELDGRYDIIWAVEVISHLNRRKTFFERTSKLLKNKGKWCIAAWMRKSELNPEEEKCIAQINKGMMVNLPTQEEYLEHFRNNRLSLKYYEDITKQVEKTWQLCSDIINKPSIYQLAIHGGTDMITFLKTFLAMQHGFSSGCFKYAAMVVEKE